MLQIFRRGFFMMGKGKLSNHAGQKSGESRRLYSQLLPHSKWSWRGWERKP